MRDIIALREREGREKEDSSQLVEKIPFGSANWRKIAIALKMP
jgi:hypothetical protein